MLHELIIAKKPRQPDRASPRLSGRLIGYWLLAIWLLLAIGYQLLATSFRRNLGLNPEAAANSKKNQRLMQSAKQAQHQRENIQVEPKISMPRMGTERQTDSHNNSDQHNHCKLAHGFFPVGLLGELVVLPAQPFHRGKYSAIPRAGGVARARYSIADGPSQLLDGKKTRLSVDTRAFSIYLEIYLGSI